MTRHTASLTRNAESAAVIAAALAVLASIISNVPAVLMLKPFVQSLPDQHRIWLTIAMASTLAGGKVSARISRSAVGMK